MRKVTIEVTATVKQIDPKTGKVAQQKDEKTGKLEDVEELVGTSRDVMFPDSREEWLQKDGEGGINRRCYNDLYLEEAKKLRGDLLAEVNPDAAGKRKRAKFISLAS